MKPARWSVGLCVGLVVLLAWPSAARAGAPAQEEPPGLTWTLDLAVESEQEAAALAETLAPRLAPETTTLGQGGVSALALSGAGDLDPLRQALYADLGWPAGPADLVLRADDPAGAAFTLVLEANLAAGYTWDWSGLDPARVALEGEPVVSARSSAPGASARISLALRPLDGEPLELRLRYRRPWQALASPRAILTLHGATLPAVLDLSDPNPAAPPEPVFSLQADASADPLPVTALALPESFDWREHASLPPVRDQGGCGSCWAFSATGLLESTLAIYDGLKVDLSEQYLLNCNEQGWGCGGGSLTASDYHQYLYISPQLAAGAVLESVLPYRAARSKCAAAYPHPYRLTRWALLPGSPPTVEQIKQAIYTYGPVASTVCVGPDFVAYQGGVLSTDESSVCGSEPGAGNHAVLLVGWNDTNTSWIARNSWGADWGDGGYIRVGYGLSQLGWFSHYVVPDSRPATPSRVGPASGAVYPAGAAPLLRWTAVRGGLPNQPIRYQVQLASDTGFTRLVLDQPGIAANQWAAALPANRVLYWRVRAVRVAPDGDRPGSWSGAGILKTLPAEPQLLAPLSPDPTAPLTVDSIRPVLSWTVAGGAGRFELQIARDLAFSRLVVTAAPGASNSRYTPAVDLPRGTRLYWRIRARNSSGAGPWSAAAVFVTPRPPGQPALSAPTSGLVLAPGRPVQLRWTVAAGQPSGYQVDVYPNGDPAHPLLSETAPATSTPGWRIEAGLPPNQVLGWRVRAFVDLPAGRVYSGWSAARQIKILPERPLLPAPDEIAPLTGLRPRLTWSAPPGGSPRYELQIHHGPVCASLLRSATPSGLAYSPSTDLPRLTLLSWRVRARAAYGAGAWSDCLSFTTPDPPGVPVLRAPTSGATLPLTNPARPRLSWNPATRQPESYRVQVAASSAFTNAWERTVPAPASALDWDEDLPPGRYFWRVRAEGAGLVSSWSAAWTFQTPAALTGLVSDVYSGRPVAGAVVRVAGTTYASAPTGADGLYRLPVVPAGARTLVISAPDYTRLTRAVSVTAGGLRTLNLTMTRLPVKIVLEWSDPTQELDAQLWLPAARPYHVHSHARGSLTAFPFAALSAGTAPGYGPETITLLKRSPGVYTYAVYRWENGAAARLPAAGAVVKVYIGGLLQQTFRLPAGDSTAPWWHVFDLDDAGQILPGAGLVETSPGPYEPYPGVAPK